MHKSKKTLTFMDCFWYKLVIGAILLLTVCLLDKYNIIKMDYLKTQMGYNINALKVVQKVNGKLNIIDLGNERETAVSSETLQYIETTNKIATNYLEGVKNYSAGVVTKITKNNKYEVTVLGLDDKTYTYGNLDEIDIHIYCYLKTNDIIGSSTTYYTLEIDEEN